MILTNLTKEDKEILYFSLSTKRCLIETGGPVMTAEDAVNSGLYHRVRDLTTEQMEGILKIKNLMNRVLAMKD